MNLVTLPLAVAALLSAGIAVSAQDAPTEKQLMGAVAARQAHMDLYSFNLGIIGSMAKSEIPYDATVASAAAANLASLATLDQSAYWLPGSAAGSVDKTRALPEIWKNMAGFEASEAALMEATVGLQAAAGENLEALQAQLGAVGKACGECHKLYRQPRN